jgi:hypothetical protein
MILFGNLLLQIPSKLVVQISQMLEVLLWFVKTDLVKFSSKTNTFGGSGAVINLQLCNQWLGLSNVIIISITKIK